MAQTKRSTNRAQQAAARKMSAVIVALVIAGFLAYKGVIALTRSDYKDGRNWAMFWESGFGGAEPWIGCKLQYMTSSQDVQTGRGSVPGAAEPQDNYTQWRKGCMSAKSYYEAQLGVSAPTKHKKVPPLSAVPSQQRVAYCQHFANGWNPNHSAASLRRWERCMGIRP